jgi:uncharacterized protein YgbK (DUF1537 family)
MIVVIADDFSGAAEIAGIAWRYGLKTVIQTEMDLSTEVDVIVVDTNSRSMNEDDAGNINRSISNTLNRSNIEWVFKKTDSVLRGHIIHEIESLNNGLKKEKVLLIANNPSSGRIIRNKKYYIDDMELNRTDFGHDPDFPAQSSKIGDILGPSKSLPIRFINSLSGLEGKGVFVPDLVKPEELTQWAFSLNNDILPAGGSDFFEAILNTKGMKRAKKRTKEVGPQVKNRLFVFASTVEKSRDTVVELNKEGIPVCDLPIETLGTFDLSDDCLIRWVDDIHSSFEDHHTVVSAILQPLNKMPGFSQKLNHFVTKMIKNVLNSTNLDEILIEGGATASNLVRSIGWKEFTVSSEYGSGIVQLINLQKPEFRLYVKPGSYSWPVEILNA